MWSFVTLLRNIRLDLYTSTLREPLNKPSGSRGEACLMEQRGMQ